MKPELIDSKREIESHPIHILKANEPIPAPGKSDSEATGFRPLSAVYRVAAILATTGAIALSLPQAAQASTLLSSRDSIEHLSTSSLSLSPKLARKFQRILDRAVEDGIPPGIAVGHGGDTLGHHSLMFHFPEDNITFVALQNSQPPNETNLMIPFLQVLQDENTSVPEPGAIPGFFFLGTGFLASRKSRTMKS